MVKVNELRIGNWIADHEAGGFFQVESIYKNAIGVYRASYRNGSIDCTIDALEEIPLTEEWLVKFGFKQYADFKIIYDLMPLCGFGYDISTKQVVILEKGNPNSHWIERKIEYVHELQNLYFALRGQELETKGGNNE